MLVASNAQKPQAVAHPPSNGRLSRIADILQEVMANETYHSKEAEIAAFREGRNDHR